MNDHRALSTAIVSTSTCGARLSSGEERDQDIRRRPSAVDTEQGVGDSDLPALDSHRSASRTAPWADIAEIPVEGVLSRPAATPARIQASG